MVERHGLLRRPGEERLQDRRAAGDDPVPAAALEAAKAAFTWRTIDAELAEMGEGAWAKTVSRSVLGVMNEFAFLAGDLRRRLMIDDPVELSLRLARVPCSPLHRRHVTPGRELEASVAAWRADHGPER